MLPFYVWADNSQVGQWMRGNSWAFPSVETVHILALAAMLGTLFLIDLRLMGIAARGLTPSHMHRQLKSFFNWGLLVMLVTGFLLFLSEALKAYDNDAFRPKMITLMMAIVFHYTVHKKAVESGTSAVWRKLVGALSVVLWFGVGAFGRAIGFL